MLILFTMCDCANCDGITLFEGTDGNGIINTSYNSGTGVLTIYYTDGTTYSTTSLIGATGPAGPAGVCDCVLVKYEEERLGAGTSGTSPTFTTLTNMTYTVPSGGAGKYELLFIADTEFNFVSSGNATVTIDIYKNGTAVSALTKKRVSMTGTGEQSYIFPISALVSDVTLAVGDIIDVRSTSTSPATAYLNYGVMKINKI
jgi:hypothetical protein